MMPFDNEFGVRQHINHKKTNLKLQFLLLLMSLPFNILMAYATFSPILILYTPDHQCAIDPDLMANSSLTTDQLEGWYIPIEEDGHKSKCFIYDRPPPPASQEDIGSMSQDLNLTKIQCQNGWNYNITGLFTSAVTEVREGIRRNLN
jgi:hypothetical protein